MQLQLAADHFQHERKILNHRRTVGLPLENRVVVNGTGELEPPAEIILAADRGLESRRGVAFAAPVAVVLEEVPDRAEVRVIDGANVRAVWTRVAGVCAAGVLDVEVFEHAEAEAGGAVPKQAGEGRAGKGAGAQRGGNDQKNAPQGRQLLIHFHVFSPSWRIGWLRVRGSLEISDADASRSME